MNINALTIESFNCIMIFKDSYFLHICQSYSEKHFLQTYLIIGISDN